MAGSTTKTRSGGPRKAGVRNADETRRKLVVAARLVFARDGYAKSRIADIAEEAERSVGVFYRYFDGKPEILAACVEQFSEDLVVGEPKRADFDQDLAGALEAAVRNFWTLSHDNRGVVSGLFEAAITNPDLMAAWRKIREAGVARFQYRVRKLQAEGKVPGLDPLLGASAITGLIEFACFNWQSEKLDFPDQRIDGEASIKTLARLLCNALRLSDQQNFPSD